jgi:hypothetical protein
MRHNSQGDGNPLFKNVESLVSQESSQLADHEFSVGACDGRLQCHNNIGQNVKNLIYVLTRQTIQSQATSHRVTDIKTTGNGSISVEMKCTTRKVIIIIGTLNSL